MKYLYFDLRALSLMRMGLALVILLDLIIRMTDLETFYTNDGVVPLNMLFEHCWNSYFVSIHTMSGLWIVQLLLFSLAFFFALMLLIGYRTQLFTFLSWFMMLSLHNRNGLILQGGDDLMRMTLFWGMFLPWGSNYSCDSVLGQPEKNSQSLISLATVAYMLQICYLYTGSALLKGPEWYRDFTAVYYAYSLDQIAYPITRTLYFYPELLKFLTALAYYFELLIPIIFFIPFRHGLFRSIAVLSIILFHTFNMCTLLIGFFPMIGIVTSIGILPSTAMDIFDRKIARLKTRVQAFIPLLLERLKHLITWKPQAEPPQLQARLQGAMLIFLIAFTFFWNLSNLSFIESKMPEELRVVGYSLRLDQSWGMFAPGVFKEDGWFVMEAETKNGEHIDLQQPEQELSFRKPYAVTSLFRNDRWRKYSENYLFVQHEFMRGYLCKYLKRKWNEEHADKAIRHLKIIYMLEMTLPDYLYALPKKQVLCECEEK